MRRFFPVLCLLALLAPARSWAFGLEHYDCTTPGERWTYAQDALSHVFSAFVGTVDAGGVGVDNGSFSFDAIGLGLRFFGLYVGGYGSLTNLTNGLLVPTTCHRIV